MSNTEAKQKRAILYRNVYMFMNILDELTPPAQNSEHAGESMELVFNHLLKRDTELVKLGYFGKNALYFIDEAQKEYNKHLKIKPHRRNNIKTKNKIAELFEYGFAYLDLIRL